MSCAPGHGVCNLAPLDYTLFRAINGLSGNSVADSVMRFVAEDFEAVLIVAVALVFLVPWRDRLKERRRGAVLATASAALALAINQLISHPLDRLRPYEAHPAHAHLLIGRSSDPSFPSDHATGAVALALGVFLYDRLLGGILFVVAALLAFARVYVGTHYPGDVLGGALIATAVTLAIYLSPLRGLLERLADYVGAAWSSLLARLFRRPVPAQSR